MLRDENDYLPDPENFQYFKKGFPDPAVRDHDYVWFSSWTSVGSFFPVL